jgi:hypothetical protein
MGLPNVEFVTDDVRNFSRERYGAFDVVICSGILYHLPGKDGCRFRFVADSMAGGPLGTYSFQFPGKRLEHSQIESLDRTCRMFS